MIPVLKEGRQYVSSPSQAPKGVAVKRGPRGGYYYEEPVAKDKKEATSKLEGKLTKDNFTFDQPIGGFRLATGLSEFDTNLDAVDNSQREYDFELEWKTPDEVLKQQYIQSSLYKKEGDVGFYTWIKASEGTERLKRYTKMLKGETVPAHKTYGDKLLPIIVTEWDRDGKLKDFQEGRTRALAAKQAGLEKIPILKAMHRKRTNEND